MSRVLLVNPPAPQPTMRDDYCSSTSKAGYAWHPIDLLAAAAWLRDRHELIWRDYAVTPASRDAAIAQLAADRADAIFGLVGAAANDDFGFWRSVRERTDAPLVLSGDLVRFAATEALAEHAFVDAVALDFTAPGLRDLLDGAPTTPGLLRRDTPEPPAVDGPFGYPVPPHELVWALPYRHPFLPPGFATVMTDHGCPHRCRYCNSGVVGWRERDLDNLAAELDWLAARRRRALLIKDMTFNAVPERTLTVLRLLRATGPWRFACYVRPDRVTDEIAVGLARAGCVMAMAGVESGDDQVLGAVRPGATVAAVSEGIGRLHRAGVPVGGHFLLGLPGEGAAQWDRTLALALRLPLAYASFNLAAPRLGTPLYVAGTGVADGSTAATRLLADEAQAAQLPAWRKRAVRAFYGRPGYLMRRAWASLRLGMLRQQIGHGLALARQRNR